MEFYNALFEENGDFVEVSFPDFENAITFGNNYKEAFEMAIDVLAAVLSFTEIRPGKTPLDVLNYKHKCAVAPVPIDEELIQTYKKGE